MYMGTGGARARGEDVPEQWSGAFRAPKYMLAFMSSVLIGLLGDATALASLSG